MNIKRLILTGTIQEVKFDNIKSNAWLVKNFSNGDIFVSYDENLDENSSIKIKPEYAQICLMTKAGLYGYNNGTLVNTIYIKGTGEVEVQPL